MQCADFKKLLSRFLEHDLASAQEKSLREHLETCQSCARSLTSLQNMVSLMRRMDGQEPPADLVERVNQKIDRPGWWESVRRQLESWRIMNMPYPAIAVTITFFLALFLSHYVTSLAPLGRALSPKEHLSEIPAQLSRPKAVASAVGSGSVPARELEFDQPVTSVSAEYAAGGRVDPFEIPVTADRQAYDADARMVKVCTPDGVCDYRLDEESPDLMAAAPAVVMNEAVQKKQPPAPVAVSPAKSEAKAKPRTVPKQKSRARSETVVMQAGDLIYANRNQNWLLTVGFPIVEAEDRVGAVLRDTRAQNISMRSGGTLNEETALIFSFVINYGKLSPVLDALQNIGTLERLTPLPLPRPEAYMGAQGMVNPKVLEEQIPVELRVVR